MPPSKRAKGAKGAKSNAAGTGTKGATGTGTSKGTNATTNKDTTNGTKGARPSRNGKNWIGQSKDHLDPDYKERRGRSRRATSPHEADDPTYTPPGGHVTSIHPQRRRSPRKADHLGFIDPENIDEDVGDNEDGEVLGEDAFDEDVDVVDGVQISSSPNRNKLHTSPKQKAMAKLKRFMNLHGNSRQPSPMEGVDQGAYDILMAPHSQDPPNVPTAAAAAGASRHLYDDEDEYNDEDEVDRHALERSIMNEVEGMGMGDDDYVAESNVDDYDELGIVKSNIDYDEDSDFADEAPPPDMSYYRETNVKRGRAMNKGGPQRQNTDGMTAKEKEDAENAYKSARKKWNDANLAKRARLKRLSEQNSEDESSDSGDDMIVYTGVSARELRTMTEVEAEPMIVGHNYKKKKYVMLRVAEEANLHNVEIANVKSCDKRLHYEGRGGAKFKVEASPSMSKNWVLRKYERGGQQVIDEYNKSVESEYKEGLSDNDDNGPQDDDDIDNDDEDKSDDIFGGEGNADDESPKRKRRRKNRRTPFKASWLVPLLKSRLREKPNMSNRECAHILRLHIRPDFLTRALVQNAKMEGRFKVFGDPTMNAHYIPGMVQEMTTRGHIVQSTVLRACDVMTMLEKIVVRERADLLLSKTPPITMTKEMKIAYGTEWINVNKEMLNAGGLAIKLVGDEEPQFYAGVYFGMSYSGAVVPHLQDVFQADACHMNFGKYTLYSCYGTTANGNTSPIAFAILFGNEDKAGWVQFFEFAKEQHPCLNSWNKTFITDQAKGLVESIKKELPEAGHFHCSYHRRKNILKYCKGGQKIYSGCWLYDKLLGAKTTKDIEKIKLEAAPNVTDRVNKYINESINDHEQFPGARCHQYNDRHIYMYGRTASSSVEAMNQANKPARMRTAVDLMQSMKLIVDLECRRYNEHKEEAHSCDAFLTPYGNKLKDDIFAGVNYLDYHIVIGEYDDEWICKVRYQRKPQRRTHFVRNPIMGSYFGKCSCGRTETEGAPCHHMMAVVRSGKIRVLTAENVMPYWYTTEKWRLQYPKDQHPLCDFSMESVKASHAPQTSWRYCPPYVAPNKAGRPKEGKRVKGVLEETKPKMMKGSASEAAEDWNRKQTKKKKKGKDL